MDTCQILEMDFLMEEITKAMIMIMLLINILEVGISYPSTLGIFFSHVTSYYRMPFFHDMYHITDCDIFR